MEMKKQVATALFGKTQADMARALNLSPRAVQLWPDDLDQKQIDMVIGAAIRLGVPIKAEYLATARVIHPVV